MAIDPIKKSSRLLQSRRYTLDTLADGQEAFTQVLDLGSSEIYSQTNLIPTASLPFSGSSQSGATSGVLKFWYRQKLTRGVESDGRQVWFFLNPAGAAGGVDSQTIQTTQLGNFISPKYSIPSLAASNTEISTPGYLATVRTSTDGITFSDPVNTNYYTFDYKNGVLQFSSSGVTPGSGDVYMSVYQYVGRTLASDSTLGYSGSFSGSFQGTSTGSFSGIGSGSFSGSFQGSSTGLFSGSFQGNGSGLTNLPASSIVGLNLSQTATGSVSASVNVGTTSFQITSGSTTLLSLTNTGNLTISGSEFIGNNLTAIGNATVTGSLAVNGVTNLNNNLIVTSTSSLRETFVTGSLTVSQNLVVLGTASFTSVTSSQLNIGTSIITVNTATPAVRFGGLAVTDSGSTGTGRTGSMLWDSQEDRWIYVTPSGSPEGYNSAIIIAGPPNTGSIGNESGLAIGRIMKAVGDDHIGSSLLRETGSTVTVDGALSITGSTLLTAPDGTGTAKYTLLTSQSAWHYSDNVGYPVGANQWGSGLNGSYFNLFTPNTDTATILRFVAGLLSASAPAPTPNTKYYDSINNNSPSLSNSSIAGYVPQGFSGSDITYLNNKGFANTGSTIFNGVGTVYTTLNPTYNFTSVANGSTIVSSSADAQLFNVGTLGTTFNVSGTLNWRFDDNFVQTVTATSQSQILSTRSSIGSSNPGLTIGEISTVNPAVIPNTYQDGKFQNIFDMTFYNAGRSLTSVSSSGWYHVSASIGIQSGSSTYSAFKDNFTKVFAAPISSISIPTQTITFTQSVVTATATSRSFSGAPYLQSATWTYSITSSGVFEPLYFGNSTIFSIGDDSSLVLIGGTTSQVMSAGNISGTSLVFSTSSVQRSTGTIPFRTDRIQSSNTSTFSTSTSDTNISQTGLGTTSYTITSTSYNRSGGTSTTSSVVLFHSASTFGQPLASGSMAYYGRAQGNDPGAVTDNSETFLGETFRLKIDSALLTGSYQNGTKFTTASVDFYNLGALDLQVKPGYLVRPGSNYGYWLADPNTSKTYKFYARAFRVSTAYSTLYVDLGKTLNNWTSTSDGVSVAIIFNSVFGGGNLSGTFGNSNPVLFDISALTSTSILTGQANNDFTNPFAEAINVYGNNGGTLTSTKYGMSLLSGLKQILNPSASPTPYVDFVVLVRYTNQNSFTPVTTITQTNS